MGFHTIVKISNDRIHEWRENPTELGRLILQAAERAEESRKKETVAGGYISAFPPRHGDWSGLFLFASGSLTELVSSEEMKALNRRLPDHVKQMGVMAKNLLKWFLDGIKEK